MARPPCAKCGENRRGSTANTAPTGVNSAAPRLGMAAPTRYTVNGRKFATLTAAQEYARRSPGAVIRQS